MRADPHEGRYPPAPERAIEPGTPEHAQWLEIQAAKQRAYERSQDDWAEEINRPTHRHVR